MISAPYAVVCVPWLSSIMLPDATHHEPPLSIVIPPKPSEGFFIADIANEFAHGLGAAAGTR